MATTDKPASPALRSPGFKFLLIVLLTIAMALPLFGASLACLAAIAGWTGVATITFNHAVSLPLIESVVAGLLPLAALI